MRTSKVASCIALLAVTLVSLAACGATKKEDEGPQGMKLDAEVVQFDSGGEWGSPFSAIVRNEDEARAFVGWFAARADIDPDSDDDIADFVQEIEETFTDFADSTYVAVVGNTSCRLPDKAELWRDDDNLVAHMLGGEDRGECVRPYTPYALFKVDSESVSGVKTIQGKAIDGDGPAELVGLTQLGTNGLADVPSREITSQAEKDVLVGDLEAANASNMEEVSEILRDSSELQENSQGVSVRRFAFILEGCGDTTAVMYVNPTVMTAELVSPSGATCQAIFYFLAVFDIRDEYVPDRAVTA